MDRETAHQVQRQCRGRADIPRLAVWPIVFLGKDSFGASLVHQRLQFLDRFAVSYDQPAPPGSQRSIELAQATKHKGHSLLTRIRRVEQNWV